MRAAPAMGSVGRSVALVLGLVLAAAALAHPDKVQPRNLDAQGWPVAAFALTDQNGQPFTQGQLLGRWTFVLVGDTQCGPPCEGALSAVAGLVQRIAPTRAVETTQVLFVSMDPLRDTAQRLRAYLVPHPPGFVAATGSQFALRQLAEDLGAAKESDPPATYRGSLVLVGPDGTIRVEYLPPFDVLLLTAAYLKMRVQR